MAALSEVIKTADWKSEKHVPVIECPDEVKASLGKEVAHPNTTEHHIRWIQLYFRPKCFSIIPPVFHPTFGC